MELLSSSSQDVGTEFGKILLEPEKGDAYDASSDDGSTTLSTSTSEEGGSFSSAVALKEQQEQQRRRGAPAEQRHTNIYNKITKNTFIEIGCTDYDDDDTFGLGAVGGRRRAHSDGDIRNYSGGCDDWCSSPGAEEEEEAECQRPPSAEEADASTWDDSRSSSSRTGRSEDEAPAFEVDDARVANDDEAWSLVFQGAEAWRSKSGAGETSTTTSSQDVNSTSSVDRSLSLQEQLACLSNKQRQQPKFGTNHQDEDCYTEGCWQWPVTGAASPYPSYTGDVWYYMVAVPAEQGMTMLSSTCSPQAMQRPTSSKASASPSTNGASTKKTRKKEKAAAAAAAKIDGAGAGVVAAAAAEEETTMSSSTAATKKAVESTVAPTERTTVMLRHLPNDYSREMLCDLLDSEGFSKAFDFVYLPIDFNRDAGLGYAFVNFSRHEDAERARLHFEGFSSWQVQSHKVCEVNWGEPLQGLEAHIARFRNSPVMHEGVPDKYKPALFHEGARISFPEPTKRIRAPRLKHRPANGDFGRFGQMGIAAGTK